MIMEGCHGKLYMVKLASPHKYWTRHTLTRSALIEVDRGSFQEGSWKGSLEMILLKRFQLLRWKRGKVLHFDVIASFVLLLNFLNPWTLMFLLSCVR